MGILGCEQTRKGGHERGRSLGRQSMSVRRFSAKVASRASRKSHSFFALPGDARV